MSACSPSMKWNCSRMKQHARTLWNVSTTLRSKPWTGPGDDGIAGFSHTLITIVTPTVCHSTSWYVVHLTGSTHLYNKYVTFVTHGESLNSKFLCENSNKSKTFFALDSSTPLCYWTQPKPLPHSCLKGWPVWATEDRTDKPCKWSAISVI